VPDAGKVVAAEESMEPSQLLWLVDRPPRQHGERRGHRHAGVGAALKRVVLRGDHGMLPGLAQKFRGDNAEIVADHGERFSGIGPARKQGLVTTAQRESQKIEHPVRHKKIGKQPVQI
jgi:hypothetical protein